MELILILFRGASPHINVQFKRAQIVTSSMLALTQGSNDAQKTMGVITMALVIAGTQATFVIPTWVIFISALVLALGVASGRLAHDSHGGIRFLPRATGARLRHADGVGGGRAGGRLYTGAPVSAGQVVNSSLVGVGSAERLSKVRWDVAGNILMAWLLTIPAAALLGGAMDVALSFVFG